MEGKQSYAYGTGAALAAVRTRDAKRWTSIAAGIAAAHYAWRFQSGTAGQ